MKRLWRWLRSWQVADFPWFVPIFEKKDAATLPADPDPHYDAANRTRHTLVEVQAAVGKRATITFTGTIVSALESDAGAFVQLAVDERWGLGPGFRLGMDLEAFDVQEGDAGAS